MEEYKGEEDMNVLSLFDGMSCGLQALKQAGILVTNYYASEVDKYAIQIAKKNHPEIIGLGDVTKWQDWDLPKIDLLIGGTPCQGFSSAGKQLNFDDPRSALFFEFVKIKDHFKPKYFLLENVKMKKEHQDVISEYLGVEPIKINSNLLSAQNRNRLYWANWNISSPNDRKLTMRDIFDPECKDITERVLLKKKGTLAYEKAHKATKSLDNKMNALLTGGQGISNSGATNIKIGLRWFIPSSLMVERGQTLPDGYTIGLSECRRHNVIGNGWTVSVIEHIFNGLK